MSIPGGIDIAYGRIDLDAPRPRVASFLEGLRCLDEASPILAERVEH
jgi:hypothetical protein